MPLLQNLRSIRFRNTLRNGTDFTLNTAQEALNFSGHVGERLLAIYQVDLSWYAESTSLDAFDVFSTGGGSTGTIIRVTGSFYDDGFDVGQQVEFHADWSLAPTTAREFEFVIDSISQNGTRIDYTITAGTQTTTGTNFVCGIWARADLAAMAPDTAFLRFNVLANGAAFSPISEVSNVSMGWFAAGIDTAGGATSTMGIVGQFQGWKKGSAEIRRELTLYTKNSSTYEVQHEFQVNPFFLLDYLPDLLNGTTPAFWQDQLNYQFEIEFRHGLNNTTSAKTLKPNTPAGISSWYGSSLGNFYTRYTKSNVAYQDTATTASVDGFQVGSKTTISFDLDRAAISGSAAGFVTGDKVGLYIAFLPGSEADYQETLTDLDSNFIFDEAFHETGTAEYVGANVIKRLNATVAAGTISVEADIEYNAAQQLKIQSGSRFVVWVQLGDLNLTVANSDRTPLLVDVGTYDVQQFVTGLASFPVFDTFVHQQEAGVDIGEPAGGSLVLWNEDGVVVDYTLRLDTNQSAELVKMTFLLVAQKTADSTYFVLDQYELDLSGSVMSGGVQQINLDTNRNYILVGTDQFGKVELITGATSPGVQDFDGLFGQKVKWQDWLFNSDADPLFYDNTKPQNNLNFSSQNYSNLNGYEIRILAIAETEGIQNTLPVRGLDIQASCNLDIFSYGTSDDGQTTGVISTHDPDTGADLGGKILQNKNTLFRTTWTNPSTDISNVYVIHRLQRNGSPGDDIEELSTINPAPANQILIPKPLASFTSLAVVGPDMVSECLIDHTRLANVAYDLSARWARFAAAANFTLQVNGCDVDLLNVSSFTGITDIQYEFRLGTTLIETVNTLLNTYTWDKAALYDGEVLEITQTITHSGGTAVDVQTQTIDVPDTCLIIFQSNMSSGGTFTPLVQTTGLTPYWRMPDDRFIQALNPSAAGGTYGFDGNPQEIRLAPSGPWSDLRTFNFISDSIFGTLDLSNAATIGPNFQSTFNTAMTGIVVSAEATIFTNFWLNNNNLTGTVDIQLLSNLAGSVRLYANANLTNVLFPVSSQIITFLWVYNCDITGVFNLSTLTGLRNNIRLNGNSNMTGVNFPPISAAITTFHLFGTGLTGSFNMSTLTGLGGDIQLHANPSLTGVVNPISTQSMTGYLIYQTGYTGNLDMSTFSQFGGSFRAYQNPNLTSITNGSSSAVFTFYWVYGSNITGSHDMSGLTGLGGSLRMNGNSNMTSILFPTSSQAFTLIHLYSCGLTALDMSTLSAIGGDITCSDNTAMTSLTLASGSNTIDNFDFDNCDLAYFDATGLTFSSAVNFNVRDNSMTAAEVNQILVDLDTNLPGTGTGTILINGSNAAPDGTSGGYDGITAKNNLIASGYTVTSS